MPESPHATIAADGRRRIARVERALLAVLGERGVELGERRAGADGDRQVGGLVAHDAGRAR